MSTQVGDLVSVTVTMSRISQEDENKNKKWIVRAIFVHLLFLSILICKLSIKLSKLKI